MRLWRRAAGALKDRNSIWIANLSKPTSFRHPEIEAAVVKATSHVETSLDRHYIERGCEYLRRSPFNLKPFLGSLSRRMEKTRSWAVALKGLHLMHVVINSRIPGVRKIGRLPFDLSDFKDAHSSQSKTWSFNVFIRSYYAYLDHKSALFYNYTEDFSFEEENEEEDTIRRRPVSITRELVLLHKLQPLIDLLIQVKPQARAADAPLVLELMEEITIEIFNAYSRMCRGIALVVNNISDADRLEATAALNAVHKASLQAEQLSLYFEYCDRIGVINSADISFIDRFSEEGIKKFEQRVYRMISSPTADDWKSQPQKEEKAIVLSTQPSDRETSINNNNNNNNRNAQKDNHFLKTIITHKWEKFEEDPTPQNPFLTLTYGKDQHLPDLIIL